MSFTKGKESANPFGSLPIGQDLKEARKLTKVEFERLANKYIYMSWNQIDGVIKDSKKDIPAIEMVLISIIHKAIIEGDSKRLEFLLDRTIGQAVRKLHVVTEVDTSKLNAPVQMTDEEKLAMIEAYKNKLLNKGKPETIEANVITKVEE